MAVRSPTCCSIRRQQQHCCSLDCLPTYLLARRLTQPLSRLVAAAAKARSGDYEAELPVDRQDELGELGREFRDLLREKRNMEEYVATLSRNLPEPVVAAETSAKPSRRAAVTLLAAEFRQYATALTGDPHASRPRAVAARPAAGGTTRRPFSGLGLGFCRPSPAGVLRRP